jgi:MFS family permease
VPPLSGREALFQAGSVGSFVGDGIRFSALPLLAAQSGAGPRAVSLLFLAGTLPWLVVSPYVGIVVDRMSRSLILVGSDAARLVCSVALLAAVGALGDATPFVLLVLTSFSFGVLETLYDVTGATVIPSLVPDDRLESANATYAGSQTLGRELGGPLLGAVLHGLSRLSPYAVGAALYAAASAALLAVHRRGVGRSQAGRGFPNRHSAGGRGERRHWWTQAAEGLAFIGRSRLLTVLAVVSGAVNLSLLAAQATSVLFVMRTLGGSGLAYSLTVAAPAAGALAASAGVSRILRHLAAPRALVIAITGAAAAFAWISLARTVWWMVVGFVGLGICFMLWNVVALSTRQRIVPDDLRGRVESAYRVISWGALPVGAGLGGLLAHHVGLRAPFIAAAALTTLAVLILAAGLARTGAAAWHG